MFAAYNNHPHTVNELLNHHADLTMTNLNDDTALSIAIKRQCKEGLILLFFKPYSFIYSINTYLNCSTKCNRRLPIYAASTNIKLHPITFNCFNSVTSCLSFLTVQIYTYAIMKR